MLFDMFFKPLKYEEYKLNSKTNSVSYLSPRDVMGIRLKGQLKVTTGTDGDTTTCTIVYKTTEKLKTLSKLEGRTIMECVPVNAFSLDTGYLSYVK